MSDAPYFCTGDTKIDTNINILLEMEAVIRNAINTNTYSSAALITAMRLKALRNLQTNANFDAS